MDYGTPALRANALSLGTIAVERYEADLARLGPVDRARLAEETRMLHALGRVGRPSGADAGIVHLRPVIQQSAEAEFEQALETCHELGGRSSPASDGGVVDDSDAPVGTVEFERDPVRPRGGGRLPLYETSGRR